MPADRLAGLHFAHDRRPFGHHEAGSRDVAVDRTGGAHSTLSIARTLPFTLPLIVAVLATRSARILAAWPIVRL